MKEIYWVTVLGNLHILVGIILSTLITIFMMTLLIYICSPHYYTSEIRSKLPSFFAKMFALIICTSLVFCFFPSKQELYTIYGIAVDNVQNNEQSKITKDEKDNSISLNHLIDDRLRIQN